MSSCSWSLRTGFSPAKHGSRASCRNFSPASCMNIVTSSVRPSHDSMMNHNAEYYNAPSRWAIYKRIMELSGETASFDKFLEYDAVNRKASE